MEGACSDCVYLRNSSSDSAKEVEGKRSSATSVRDQQKHSFAGVQVMTCVPHLYTDTLTTFNLCVCVCVCVCTCMCVCLLQEGGQFFVDEYPCIWKCPNLWANTIS